MKLLPNLTVGFTGTRQRLTKPQELALEHVFKELGATEFHHGDCVGADIAAHIMQMVLHVPKIVIHPPTDDLYRAHCERLLSCWTTLEVKPPREYLARNHRIVNCASILVAAPKDVERPVSLRGQGTWTTIGYAEQASIPRILVLPNGTVQRET